MAAVLASGPGAVLSHRSAAVLWGIRRGDSMRTDVTAPARCAGATAFMRAIEQAEALRLADTTPLMALVARYSGRRGTAVLKTIVGKEAHAAGITRSELEDRFLRFLAERGLPKPDPNAWLQHEGRVPPRPGS